MQANWSVMCSRTGGVGGVINLQQTTMTSQRKLGVKAELWNAKELLPVYVECSFRTSCSESRGAENSC